MKTGFAALCVSLAAGAAFAGDISTVNSVFFENRFYNDIADSALIATDNFPASVSWNEDYTPDVDPNGGYTNRHVAWLSNNGGASAFSFWGGGYGTGGQTFTMSADINIRTGSPTTEGGFIFANNRSGHIPPFVDTGGGLYVKGNGEVFMGAGSAIPFHFLGFAYTPGTTARISLTYTAPGNGIGSIQVSILDSVLGLTTGPTLPWNPEPDSIGGFGNGSKVGMFVQSPRQGAIDSYTTVFSNISVVPAPGALAVLGLGGLMASRRRR